MGKNVYFKISEETHEKLRIVKLAWPPDSKGKRPTMSDLATKALDDFINRYCPDDILDNIGELMKHIESVGGMPENEYSDDEENTVGEEDVESELGESESESSRFIKSP